MVHIERYLVLVPYSFVSFSGFTPPFGTLRYLAQVDMGAALGFLLNLSQR